MLMRHEKHELTRILVALAVRHPGRSNRRPPDARPCLHRPPRLWEISWTDFAFVGQRYGIRDKDAQLKMASEVAATIADEAGR